MKTIGLIGGISWVSTVDYYKYINQLTHEKTNGEHNATCIIYSFNYTKIKKNNAANDWDKTLVMITKASKNLIKSGADVILLCANTMHLIADQLQQQITVPIIHIAIETAKEIENKKLKKVGLLGTKFTMELDFFKDKLKERNIEAIVPNADDRSYIHQTINDELGIGLIRQETKNRYLSIIENLISEGAKGIILGCTEIPLLLQQKDVSVPVFDTTFIHANAAVDYSLRG